ncbi:MAG: phosphatase domain-containing protein [Qipengyuania sp.]
MALLKSAPIRVQPYFGYRNASRLFLTARALPPARAGFEKRGRFQAVRTMMSQFASRQVPDLPVELEIRDREGEVRRYPGVTDHDGFVHFDIAFDPEWQPGALTRWDVVALHWLNRDGEQCVEGHVLAPGSTAALAVISDIDDTIIETGITGSFRQIARNWRRIVLEMPDERLLVPGADVFYNALGGGAVKHPDEAMTGDRIAATHHPFFYVSSSPWNLFSYLVAFQKSRNLPLGPLMLRNWGLNRETFGSSSHGVHKQAAIAGILETFPQMRFALIGDDTQGDLPAFAQAVAEHSGQIRAVFIRRAGEAFSPEELMAKDTIEAARVPLWLGDSYETGQKFLSSIGLAHDGEAEKIVETVDQAHDPAKAGKGGPV